MSQEADWLQWHEDRWNLPPSQGGRQEYAPNGPPRGIVPFPLTDAEFDLLLKRFFLADDMLTDAQVDGHEVLDTETLQTLRGKLMEWVEAYGQFPTLADTNAHSNADPALLQPNEYYKWFTVADIKSQMPYTPATQLKDSGGNDLPDDFPVLVLAPRKYGAHSWAVFYLDTHINGFDMTGYVTKAKDFVTNHPGFEFILTENGGWIDDTDIVGQMYLERSTFLNSQYVINFILNTITNNIGILNLSFPNIIINYPGSPPGGTWPPGTGPAPDPNYFPPSLHPDNDVTFACGDQPIYNQTGPNAVDFAANLGFAALAALPIPVRKEDNLNIKTLIDTAIPGLSGYTVDRIEAVELCFTFGYLDRVEVQGYGITENAIKSKPVTVTTTTKNTANPPNTAYNYVIPPTAEWATGEFKFNVPALGTSVGAKGIVAVSTGDNTLILDEYQNLETIALNCELLPAIFDASTNSPFDTTTGSPVLEISIVRIRVKNNDWRGVSVNVQIDQACTVVNYNPGFLQDYISWDWLNQQGDRDMLFTGVNWQQGIWDGGAILLEVYSPSAGQGLWMPASGSGAQGIMDAWRTANPQVYRDNSGAMILYADGLATNQICYTWLRPPNGQTNFALDMTPIPFNGWIKIVAFLNGYNSQYTIQQDSYRCNSIVYPPYPKPEWGP